MKYEWDEGKNIENQINHDGISIEEVVPMFERGGYDVAFDGDHTDHQGDRFHAFGEIEHHGKIVAVFIEYIYDNPEDDTIRIISARKQDEV